MREKTIKIANKLAKEYGYANFLALPDRLKHHIAREARYQAHQRPLWKKLLMLS